MRVWRDNTHMLVVEEYLESGLGEDLGICSTEARQENVKEQRTQAVRILKHESLYKAVMVDRRLFCGTGYAQVLV